MSIVLLETTELRNLIAEELEKALFKRPLTVASIKPEESTLLTIQEASTLLNVSLSTLHSYKKQGKLPFHRIGRRVYFKKTEILEALNKIG